MVPYLVIVDNSNSTWNIHLLGEHPDMLFMKKTHRVSLSDIVVRRLLLLGKKLFSARAGSRWRRVQDNTVRTLESDRSSTACRKESVTMKSESQTEDGN